MIFSENLILSDQQAVTATAVSTNVIDLGATGTVHGDSGALVRDVGPGTPIPLLIQVTDDFATLTSLTISVQVDADAAFSNQTTVLSQTIPVADLVAGKKTAFVYVPHGVNERFLRLNYAVTGDNATAGKITAGIVAGDVQSNV